MISFALYAANCTGNLLNCIYPKKITVTDKESMLEAVKFDHVTAKYKGNYRNTDNFIQADCVVLDCDNDHSDVSTDWVTAADVAAAFHDVPFMAAYSRNHMKQKCDKSPRPRFHVYFMIEAITDASEYAALKRRISSAFPYFDNNALDSARFIFGTDNADVEFHDGNKSIEEFLSTSDFESWDNRQEEVPEGKRNSTLSHYAGKVIKRLGNTDEAYALFLKKAERCNPPLEENELNLIWNSAVKFGKKISTQEGYIPPEEYGAELKLKPEDFSDVGQAIVLSSEYKVVLRYSPATDYIVYNGSFWEESKPKAQAISQDLTARQGSR